MARFPVDTESRKIDSRACAIVHYQLDYRHWIIRTISGQDVGVDCQFELAVNGKWTGRIIEAQIKGTTIIEKYKLKREDCYSFPFEIKTINYGLRKANSFLLLLVDVKNERVYYCPLQEYYIENKGLFAKLYASGESQKTINIKISENNIFKLHDADLTAIAQKTYIFESDGNLRSV